MRALARQLQAHAQHGQQPPLELMELDWSHPLAERLIWCSFDTIDFITGAQAVFFGGSCIRQAHSHGASTNTGAVTGTGLYFPYTEHLGRIHGLKDFTVFVGASLITQADWVGPVTIPWHDAGGSGTPYLTLGFNQYQNDSSARLFYATYGGLNYARSETTGTFWLRDGDYHVYAVVCDQAGAQRAYYYRDGIEIVNAGFNRGAGVALSINTTNPKGVVYHTPDYNNAKASNDGHVFFYFIFEGLLSAQQVFDLSQNPYQLLSPRTNFFWVPAVGGGQSVQLGLVSEAETAYAVLGAKTFNLAIAGETESAQPMQPDRALELGYVAESETAMPVGGAKARQLGALGEPEAAHPLTIDRGVVLGPVAEGETVYPLSHSKAVQLGIVVENETAHPITVGGGIEQRRGAGRFDDGAFSD